MSTALRKDEDGKYTYTDYAAWNDDKRYELVDGVAYAMAGPGVAHQRISRKLLRKIDEHLDTKDCEVFSAPFDVRLNTNKDDDTVLQPDLLVICNPDKISDGKSCNGAPDLVIEILSPPNTFHDRVRKLKKYKEAGVKEIWFAEPNEGFVEVLVRRGDAYDMDGFDKTEQVPVDILPGLVIDLSDIFEVPKNAEESL